MVIIDIYGPIWLYLYTVGSRKIYVDTKDMLPYVGRHGEHISFWLFKVDIEVVVR